MLRSIMPTVMPSIVPSIVLMLASLQAITSSCAAEETVPGGATAEDLARTEAFAAVVAPTEHLRKLASGMGFVEGPLAVVTAADPNHRSGLVFSDIPASHLLGWDGATTAVVIEDSEQSNGNAFANGTLFSCHHRSHALVATAWPAATPSQVLVDSYRGEPLNSPNDLAIASDGAIWFTDPTYGLGTREKRQERNRVYRFDPKTRELLGLIEDFDEPNGICFSPDETTLYVADSGKPHHIIAFNVDLAGSVSAAREFAVVTPGVPDGIACDVAGRLYVSAGDGVQVFGFDGQRIGTIEVPESPANLCFGGEDGKTLYITAKTSLYAIRLRVAGAWTLRTTVNATRP